MQEFIKECLSPLYELQCMKGKAVFSHSIYTIIDIETKNNIMFYIAMQDKRLMPNE